MAKKQCAAKRASGLLALPLAVGLVCLARTGAAGSRELTVTGPFGERLDRMVRYHVEATDAKFLAEIFHGRSKPGWWQTEFWGKYMHSAVPFWKRTGSTALKANIDAGIASVLAAQEADGYIGDYSPDRRCDSGWDVWGMKYTLLGLLHYYDGTGDAKSLNAAKRLCDYLIGQFGVGGCSPKPLVKTGGWGGLPSGSLLEPVVWLYVRTQDKRYLDFATEIVRQVGEDPDGPQLIAQADVPVADRRLASAPKNPKGRDAWYYIRQLTKAYEMMSCYQGLLEYYEATGRRDCLEASVKAAESIVRDEINLAGGAAARELWCHGARQQYRHFAWQQETCVITTWLRLCEKLLAVTGDPKWADQMEKTFYNAYLGALNRQGDRFASYTPLAGYRSDGHHHCELHTDCCNSNGPRGYLSVLNQCLTSTGDVITVNFYLSGNARVALDGVPGNVRLQMYTLYPKSDTVRFEYRSREASAFALRLRVPAYSARTAVKVNDRPVETPVAAGAYLTLRRTWQPADRIEIVFDMPVEMHRLGDHVAFTRGPVCLARDTRFGDGALDEDIAVDQITSEVLKSFRTVRPPTTDMFMAVAAALPCGCHAENPDAGDLPATVHFTDFASAGNTWQPGNRYQVWLPAVLDIRNEKP